MNRRLGTYSSMNPGQHILGALPPGSTRRTVILRPKSGAAPGFPGFFAWLAATHPELYSYVRVALPDNNKEGTVTGGAQLGSFGDTPISNDIGYGEMTPDQVAALTAAASNTTDPALIASNTGPDSSTANSIISTISHAASAFLPVVQQQQLLNLNLARARSGLPPLNTAAYESANQGLNVGLNPATRNTLLLLGGGLAGVWLLSRLFSRRA